MTKRCCGCKITKETTEFGRDKSRRDGLFNQCRECRSNYYSANSRRIIAAEMKQYWEHHEDIRKRRKPYGKRYYATNKKRMKAAAKRWMRIHPERAAHWGLQYRLAHPETGREASRRRKHKINSSFRTPAVLAFYRRMKDPTPISCRWCERVVTVKDREVDHVIPLALGGLHVIENLCCACKKCNRMKHTKMPDEFMAQLKSEVA